MYKDIINITGLSCHDKHFLKRNSEINLVLFETLSFYWLNPEVEIVKASLCEMKFKKKKKALNKVTLKMGS